MISLKKKTSFMFFLFEVASNSLLAWKNIFSVKNFELTWKKMNYSGATNQLMSFPLRLQECFVGSTKDSTKVDLLILTDNIFMEESKSKFMLPVIDYIAGYRRICLNTTNFSMNEDFFSRHALFTNPPIHSVFLLLFF